MVTIYIYDNARLCLGEEALIASYEGESVEDCIAWLDDNYDNIDDYFISMA